MLDNEFYSKENHKEYEVFDLGDFELERGGSLPDCKLAYAVLGELNDAKDNAVLFPVMFSGTSGSLQHYVADGLALDPGKYCVIIPNQIGNGISSSPHNTPAPNAMSAFPAIDIADDVRAQQRLVSEHLGIEKLALVLGWSMGAQQTYEWAVRYPEMVERAAPIAGTARCTPHDRLYVETFCEALKSDPAFNGGEYGEPHAVDTGLRRLARVFALMGVCPEFYKREMWKSLDIASYEDFLPGFWEAWFAPMDPNALLCMADKWKTGDVSAPHGKDLAAALGRITAKTTVIAFSRDMFIPLEDCEDEQALVPNSKLEVLDSLWGHFAMMGLDSQDFERINAILKDLLDS